MRSETRESERVDWNALLIRGRKVGSVLFILLVLGFILRPIEDPAWKAVKAGQPELKLEEVESALGQGLIVGVLGGFRAIVADFLWIRINTIWEKRERVKMDAMLRLVHTIDPRPKFFWINGVRMTAYDVPNWRVQNEGGYDVVSDERRHQIELEQSAQAFDMLENAMAFHPDEPAFVLEKAQIYLNRLKDDAAAAEWFLKGSLMPGASNYAARVYAELLRKQGKNEEAYDYLKHLHTSLPNVPESQKNILIERIREVEGTLKIPVWERYAPGEIAVGASLSNPSLFDFRDEDLGGHDHNCAHGCDHDH